jgi:hypothetical protein
VSWIRPGCAQPSTPAARRPRPCRQTYPREESAVKGRASWHHTAAGGRDARPSCRGGSCQPRCRLQCAIDDFGTGYSSLAHLQRFPVDALKIDRSFIAGLENNKEGETLIHTLVQLGKALSIETFAEGIEQQQELSLLREEDCDSGQGFLFARPLDAPDAEAFFRRWAAEFGADGSIEGKAAQFG